MVGVRCVADAGWQTRPRTWCRVIPQVPVRQWVLSLPYAVRYRLAYDSGMVTEVLGVFIRALFGDIHRRAADYGIEKGRCGAVTFVQRVAITTAADCAGPIRIPARSRMDLNMPRPAILPPHASAGPLIRSV